MFITSAATGLLVISFQALGWILMDYKTHVRLIDTHAEGIGRHDDAGSVILPVFLPLRALLHRQSRMVKIGAEAVLVIKLSDLGSLLPAANVDYAAAFYAARYVQQFAKFILLVLHHVADVLSLKTLLEN